MKRSTSLAALAALAACSQEPAPAPAESEMVAAEPAPAAGEPFRYTSLAGCELLRSAPDEAGFYEHECPGEGGYRLRYTEADLREDLTVIAPGGGGRDRGLTALAGGAFNSLGETVEWRGSERDGRFVPVTLIVRQQVMEDPDPQAPEISYLAVVRLVPSACVIARIPPGGGQNEQARRLADAGGACLDISR